MYTPSRNGAQWVALSARQIRTRSPLGAVGSVAVRMIQFVMKHMLLHVMNITKQF